MEIDEFLLARIDEDETWARDDAEFAKIWGPGHPPRLLANCAAKRAIIAMGPSRCGGDWSDGEPPFPGASPHYPVRYLVGCDGCAAAELADFDRQAVLAHLAAVYADHPDFDPAWSVTADAR